MSGNCHGIVDAKTSSASSQTKLRDLTRQFRLQSAFSILARCIGSRWNADAERRKVAIHQNRAIAALHSLLHIVPLSGAIALLVFQWTNYWVGHRDEYSSTLQFAAKLHELSMQASIVEILLGLIRIQLVEGLVPFGMLSGAMQPNQLSYLWSLDYISIFRSQAFRGWRKVFFAVALPLLIALTALVGPSSAVLMIPRLGSLRTEPDLLLYANTTDKDLYPTQNISATRLNFDVQEMNSTLWFSELHQSIPYSSPSTQSNTISHFNGYLRNKRLLRWSTDTNREMRMDEANATIPTTVITGLDMTGGSNLTKFVTAPYPMVGVRCWNLGIHNINNWFRTPSSMPWLPAPSELILKVSDTVELRNNRIFYVNDNTTTIHFSPIWMSTPEYAAYPWLAIFFSGRTDGTWNQSASVGPGLLSSIIEDQNPDLGARAEACAVSTSWNTGEIILNRVGGDTIIATDESSPREQSKRKNIAFNVTGVDALHSAKFNAMIEDLLYKEHLVMVNSAGILAATIAITIADVPKGDSSDGGIRWVFSHETNADEYSLYRIITSEYGYGYGARSTAVYLSMTVLLLYCFVVITNLLYTFSVGVASTAWSSGLELLALALQSRKPDHIQHTGVGIDSVKTLGESVGIRVNNNNEVELVFAQDRDLGTRGLRKLERNRVY